MRFPFLAGLLLAAVLYVAFAVPILLQGSEVAFTALLAVLHVGAMALNFYLLWYASRGLASAEVGEVASLDHTIGLFVALWLTAFLPAGAWWAHKRARQVAGIGAAPNTQVELT